MYNFPRGRDSDTFEELTQDKAEELSLNRQTKRDLENGGGDPKSRKLDLCRY